MDSLERFCSRMDAAVLREWLAATHRNLANEPDGVLADRFRQIARVLEDVLQQKAQDGRAVGGPSAHKERVR